MKKHLFRTILFLSALALFSSCLKDDPKNNATIYYGYQYIPNINEFMPQELLAAFGNENLHYGDEPPKIEGSFVANAVELTRVIRAYGSNWIQQPTPIPTPQYFNFYEQHKGIAKLNYKYPKGNPGDYTYYLEQSNTDTTYFIVNENMGYFTEDTIAPIYFKENKHSIEDFNTVYIMGEDPYFTVYYYEIRDMNQHFLPLNAAIFSGRLEKETVVVTDTVTHKTDTIKRPVIKDAIWGFETMKYFNDGTALQLILNANYQTLPRPGDVMLLRNQTDIHVTDNLP